MQAYQITILLAAEMLGGLHTLSDRLGVPRDDLVRWMKGPDKPPKRVFQQLIDLLDGGTEKPRKQRDRAQSGSLNSDP